MTMSLRRERVVLLCNVFIHCHCSVQCDVRNEVELVLRSSGCCQKKREVVLMKERWGEARSPHTRLTKKNITSCSHFVCLLACGGLKFSADVCGEDAGWGWVIG